MISHKILCLMLLGAIMARADKWPSISDDDQYDVASSRYCLTHPCVPNYNLLGSGVDVLSGEFKRSLVHFAFPGSNVTLGKFGNFALPLHASAINLGPEEIVTNAITGTEEYSRVLAASYGLIADDLTAAYFSQSRHFMRYWDRANSDWLFLTCWTKPYFELQLDMNGLLRHNPLFMRDVSKLPMTYKGNEERYLQFLQIWGTHVITNLVYGGSISLETFSDGCASRSFGGSYLAEYIRYSFDKVAGIDDPATYKYDPWVNVKTLYNNSRIEILGGKKTCSLNKCNWEHYIDSIDISNIAVVRQTLRPISSLLGEDQNIASNVQFAITDYLEMNSHPSRKVLCTEEHVVRDEAWKVWGLIAIGLIALLIILLTLMLIRYATKVTWRHESLPEERVRLVRPAEAVVVVSRPAEERSPQPPIVERP